MKARETRHTAVLRGTSRVPLWRLRGCRRCPAEAHASCLKWNVTRESWDRMDSPHPQRRSPDGHVKSPPDASAEISSCADAYPHGYHWIVDGRTWCRGRV